MAPESSLFVVEKLFIYDPAMPISSPKNEDHDIDYWEKNIDVGSGPLLINSLSPRPSDAYMRQ